MNKNTESTRYFSDRHEKSVCSATNAYQVSNSGAGKFKKGDCINKEASLLIECKTVMNPKASVSIKKDWVDKNREEAFENRLENNCIAFNFEPGGDNFYVISEKLMAFLVEKLEEEYKK